MPQVFPDLTKLSGFLDSPSLFFGSSSTSQILSSVLRFGKTIPTIAREVPRGDEHTSELLSTDGRR
jgi:hypothetical protein